MIEEISDNKLLFAFRRLIDKHGNEERRLHKSTYYCGSKVITQSWLDSNVFVIKNDKSARFAGVATCKNSWLCPVCSARVMSKYASDIAAAIDALQSRSRSRQLAAMFTLTIPHTSGMTCEETTEILFDTWKDFITHGNKNVKENSESGKKKRWNHHDPFSLFCETFGCVHRVRVGEYTYGEHGWHPHFHCLFWVDADKFKYLKNWEETLNRRWLELAKKITLKHWNKRYPDKENNKKRLEIMYSKLNDESQGVYISKDKAGEIIVQKSSSYICGWGADKELTGNVKNKASHEGHKTPRQLLEEYANGNEQSGELYLEFARATKSKSHRRINFSLGLRKIINQYKQTKEYAETYKKKVTDEAKANGIWREVCWFSNQQWNEICLAEKTSKLPVRYMILKAAFEHGLEYIEEMLLHSYNIDIRMNRLRRPPRADIWADTFKFVLAA